MGARITDRTPLQTIIVSIIGAALVIPALFIAFEAHHDCDGADCDICHVVAGAAQLTQVGADLPHLPLFAYPALFFASFLTAALQSSCSSDTLVTLKVRIND